MGIQSTKTVSRAFAIERIQQINNLALDKDYRSLELITSESNSDGLTLQEFVDTYIIETNIEKWSNKMLEDKLDERFFRESIFDNYIVTDDGTDPE
jgi:hypothetical protein